MWCVYNKQDGLERFGLSDIWIEFQLCLSTVIDYLKNNSTFSSSLSDQTIQNVFKSQAILTTLQNASLPDGERKP